MLYASGMSDKKNIKQTNIWVILIYFGNLIYNHWIWRQYLHF